MKGIQLNSINPAYLAGVIDSDGSISLCRRHCKRKNVNYTLMVQLSWTEKDLVKAFMNKLVNSYGGSVCRSDGRWKRFANSKAVLRYSVTGKNAVSLLEDILPYLHLKQEQAVIAISAHETIQENKKSGVRTRPEHVSKHLESFYKQMKLLNTKNGREKYV